MSSGNYCAFYVSEPFNPSELGAHATPDFIYYNLMKGWKANDSSYPFIDSHDSTYSVRDGSDWESTLKPRLRSRLRNSKNIVLFLSSDTKNSAALREEIDYGINSRSLPVIVIYPEYKTNEEIQSSGELRQEIRDLWSKLPIFRDSMSSVATIHLPMKKELIRNALRDTDFMLKTQTKPGRYFYPV